MGVAADCVRVVVLSVNLLFMFVGLALTVGGTVVQLMYKDVVAFVPHEVFSLPVITIIIGVAVFTIAFFAHCGASKKNVCMLQMFIVLLGLLFVLEITAGFAAYVFHSELEHGVETRMNKSMQFYGDEKHGAVTMAWNGVQSGLQCCGLKSYTDWNPYLIKLRGYPPSCSPGSKQSLLPPVFARGCLSVLVEAVRTQIVILAAVGIGVAVLQAIAILFAWSLVRAIRSERKTADMEPLVG